MSSRRIASVVAVLWVLCAAVLFGGDLLRDREPTAGTGTPIPRREDTPVDVAPGDELCITGVPLSPDTGSAELRAMPGDPPPAGLVGQASGDGYRSAPAPLTPTGGEAVRLRFDPPDRELAGRICVRNEGADPVALHATAEPETRTRLGAELDGEPVTADPALRLFEPQTTSFVAYLPELVSRIADLRGFLGAEWLVWLVLALVAVGVPVAVWLAYRDALDDA